MEDVGSRGRKFNYDEVVAFYKTTRSYTATKAKFGMTNSGILHYILHHPRAAAIDGIKERFFSRVDKSSDCWNWTGWRSTMGYGLMKLKGQNVLAHRFAYTIAHHLPALPPKNLFVCHRCDNPLCVNPSHLFLGTQQDNMDDMVRKNRSGCGKKTHCKNGHPFSPDNTRIHLRMRPGGRRPTRVCKICAAKRLRIARLKKRGEQL